MFDQRFLTSKVGSAALVSIAAMIAFNVFAFTHQLGVSAETLSFGAPMLVLA